MCHRMMVVARIDELLTLLDSRHQDIARVGPLLWVHGEEILV